MLKDGPRIKETTSTTGTGALSLIGAETGFQTIVAALGTGNTMLYWLLDGNGIDWEMGQGTITDGAPDTFSRDTVYYSTNANAAIDLSANTHVIFNAPVPGKITGAMDFMDQIVSRALERDTGLVCYAAGTVSGVTTLTLDYTNGSVQKATATGGTITLGFSNWPPTGNEGLMLLYLTNFGLATVVMPTAKLKKKDDTYAANWAAYVTDRGGAAALPSAEVAALLIRTKDAGATLFMEWL